MTVTIYHNPKCSTSRNTLAIIRDRGIEPEIIEYLKSPPNVETVTQLLADMSRAPRDIMRAKQSEFSKLGLGDPGKTNAELIAAMVANPILIERPIVVSPKGTRLCRPKEKVLEIL